MTETESNADAGVDGCDLVANQNRLGNGLLQAVGDRVHVPFEVDEEHGDATTVTR